MVYCFLWHFLFFNLQLVPFGCKSGKALKKKCAVLILICVLPKMAKINFNSAGLFTRQLWVTR